jgi:hypothetical protein
LRNGKNLGRKIFDKIVVVVMPIKWNPELIAALRKRLAQNWQRGEMFRPESVPDFEQALFKAMHPAVSGRLSYDPILLPRSHPSTGEFHGFMNNRPKNGYLLAVRESQRPAAAARTVAHEFGHGFARERGKFAEVPYPYDVISKKWHQQTPEEYARYRNHPEEVFGERLADSHEKSRKELLKAVQEQELWKNPRLVPKAPEFVKKRLLDILSKEPKFGDKVVKFNKLTAVSNPKDKPSTVQIVGAARGAFGSRVTGRALNALGWNLEEINHPLHSFYKNHQPTWNEWPPVQPSQNTFPTNDYRDQLLGLPSDYRNQSRKRDDGTPFWTNTPYEAFLRALRGSQPK